MLASEQNEAERVLTTKTLFASSSPATEGTMLHDGGPICPVISVPPLVVLLVVPIQCV